MSDSIFSMPISFEQIIGASSDAVIVHDLHNQVLYWNAAAELLYGWSEDEVLGRPVEGLFYLDEDAREEAVEVLCESGHWCGELAQTNRHGEVYMIRSRQQLFRGATGEPVAIVCYNTNVTEQRIKENAEAKAHLIRSSTLLAGGIAHELNNALAPIMLSSAMLKRSLEDDSSRRMLSMIEKSADKAVGLIADLLSFERGKRNGNEVIRQAQVERSFKRLEAKLVPAEVRFQLDVCDDLWGFRSDMAEISGVFGQVIQNACEAMPEGGDLRVTVSNHCIEADDVGSSGELPLGVYVEFAFSDTGRGIPEDFIEHVAEPFFTTKEPKQGYGFGLANAQAIVKGHKGGILLDSARDQGTTIRILLPAEPIIQEDVAHDPVSPVLQQEGAGQCVLVAEDEFFIREMIEQVLRDRGYSVIAVPDGAAALKAYQAQMAEIDLVIINVNMPVMDGTSLCRALREMSPTVRILISSGHSQNEALQRIQTCGVTEFLTKPYTATVLADRVRAILAPEQK
jgi:PAS domain S-box-containing protein